MQAAFPAWNAVVPVASDRHSILAVLIAMAIGAVSAGSVIVFLVGVSPTSPESAPIALHATVTAAPAVQPGAVVQGRPSIDQPPPPSAQTPAPMSESLPQPTGTSTLLPALAPPPVAIGVEADHTASDPDAERQIVPPGAQTGPVEPGVPGGGVAQHRYRRRSLRFQTPNHW
ncbi:MAG TPA: hypothetical protein VL048_21115 [Xanthobacteraceae bacterium]|nr:hypothetical protein [Xanthobacteraceae bacterium]